MFGGNDTLADTGSMTSPLPLEDQLVLELEILENVA
jgi:hypothetical protein